MVQKPGKEKREKESRMGTHSHSLSLSFSLSLSPLPSPIPPMKTTPLNDRNNKTFEIASFSSLQNGSYTLPRKPETDAGKTSFCRLWRLVGTHKLIIFIGWEPWSSGYGRRLIFQRSWVWIPALYTGWTFSLLFVIKIVMFLWKDENKRKRGWDGPFLKKLIFSMDHTRPVYLLSSFFLYNLRKI